MKPCNFQRPLAAARLGLGAGLAWLGGCQIPPPRPAPARPEFPAQFAGALPAAGAVSSQPGNIWWESFRDPVLTRLVVRALEANYDLKLADARWHEARALWLEAAGDRSPSVRSGVEYRRQRQPPLEKSREPLLDQFFVSGFDGTWEADLFGRVRALATAARAKADVQASIRAEVALTVAAEVARNYFELTARAQAQSALQRSIALRSNELKLTQRRLELGTANVPDIAVIQQKVRRLQAESVELSASMTRVIRRLSVLTVRPDSDLTAELAQPPAPADEPALEAIGSPAEVLRRRPDIRQAEQELVASAAIEESARAALFPRITFSGQLSFFAFGWGLGPNLTWDIFDRRRVESQRARASAQTDAALVRYRSVVIAAVEDVENALTGLAAVRERRDALRSLWDHALEHVAQTRKRIAHGMNNRADLLAAELAASDAAQAYALSAGLVGEAWIAVFKSIGGDGTPAPAPDSGNAPAP